MLGLVLDSQPILLLGIVLFGVVAFFQLVMLPVELNASTVRLKRWRVSISWRTRTWPVRERCSAPRR